MKNIRLMPRPYGEIVGCGMMSSEDKTGVVRDDGVQVHLERPPM